MSSAAEPVNLDVDAYPFDTLSEYGFFAGALADLAPVPGVVGYTVAAPLWADAAEKGRFFAIPPGSTIERTDEGAWEFPTGSVFIKTFYFDEDRGQAEELRIVETRLIVREDDGHWQSYGYLWDEAQTEATRVKAGADVVLDFVDDDGVLQSQLYLVPDQLACETCHDRDDVSVLLGPSTRQMNTAWPIGGDEAVNQIDWLAEHGYFSADVPAAETLPALARPDGDASLNDRARAYLHGNCSHCHRRGGLAGGTGLRLSAYIETPSEYGVCNALGPLSPSGRGRSFDIWPGRPDKSFLPFRMASTDPAVKMPELPNLTPDDFGVALIEQWITELPGEPCE
ncbi:MAG: hypothetical protein AAGA54_33440 [Myxococcota bacterium]